MAAGISYLLKFYLLKGEQGSEGERGERVEITTMAKKIHTETWYVSLSFIILFFEFGDGLNNLQYISL